MSKAIVIFGSTMGNTERLSEIIVEGLKEAEFEVLAKNVTDAKIGDIAGYDLVLLGSSTWGEGELQDDFYDFYESMNKEHLKGIKAAVFGTGDNDNHPDTFCGAVDLIEERLKASEASIIAKSFKVDGDVEDVLAEAKEWAMSINAI